MNLKTKIKAYYVLAHLKELSFCMYDIVDAYFTRKPRYFMR